MRTLNLNITFRLKVDTQQPNFINDVIKLTEELTKVGIENKAIISSLSIVMEPVYETYESELTTAAPLSPGRAEELDIHRHPRPGSPSAFLETPQYPEQPG